MGGREEERGKDEEREDECCDEDLGSACISEGFPL